MENLNFDGGILHDVFNCLQIKVSQFNSQLDKHCIIALDEMSITPGRTLDQSNNTYVGYVTLTNANNCNAKEFATHALVIMLGGIGSRWKQVIAYYFTESSFEGSKLKEIICDIIDRVEKIGLYVHGVISDMGS